MKTLITYNVHRKDSKTIRKRQITNLGGLLLRPLNLSPKFNEGSSSIYDAYHLNVGGHILKPNLAATTGFIIFARDLI